MDALFNHEDSIQAIHHNLATFLATTRLTIEHWMLPPQRDRYYAILARFIEAHYRLFVTLHGGNSVSLFLVITFRREEFYHSSPSGSTRSRRSVG
jgi:hypothetical protein